MKIVNVNIADCKTFTDTVSCNRKQRPEQVEINDEQKPEEVAVINEQTPEAVAIGDHHQTPVAVAIDDQRTPETVANNYVQIPEVIANSDEEIHEAITNIDEQVPEAIKINDEQIPEVIAYNDDHLTEILVCLPIKSLSKFKSVSKHWKFLISSPQFLRRFHSDSYLISGLLLHRNFHLSTPEYDFVPLKNQSASAPFKSLPFGLGLFQSCHGLILCANYHIQHEYYIYNPTTKQFCMLPRPIVKTSTIFHGFNLAYDPVKSPHYNIVCVYPSDEHEHDFLRYQIEIYSSETRTWRLSGDSFTSRMLQTQSRNGVFWNGTVHWIDFEGSDSLYFNVDEEQLRKMPMPPIRPYGRRMPHILDGWKSGRRLSYFGESREHLHLVELYDDCPTKFDVYEMERDYSGWFVKYKVDLDAIRIVFPEMIRSYRHPINLEFSKFAVLCIVREANDAESYMVLHIPGKAILFNLNDSIFIKIFDFDPGSEDIEGSVKFGWFDAYQYIATLASI